MVTLLDPHVTEVGLDLMLLGDLDPANTQLVRAHIGMCQRCRETYEALEQTAREFDDVVFPRTEARVTRALHARQDRSSRTSSVSWRWKLSSAVAAGATVGLFLFLTHHRQEARVDDSAPILREKGHPSLTIFARRADRVFRLESGMQLHPGDRLRFTADPAGFSYLLVASIDASGHASVYFPYDGTSSGKLDAHQHFESDFSIALDETRGPERLYALFTRREPLDAAAVRRALLEVGARGPDQIRQTLRLEVSADSQESVLVEK